MRTQSFSSNFTCVALASLLLGIATAGTSYATVCIVPDNGSGSAALPPTGAGCTQGYLSPDDVHMIIDGLPVGQTIEVDAQHSDFICDPANPLCSFPVNMGTGCAKGGGSLGGEQECHASSLVLEMEGTGGLVFNRTIGLPINFETHVAPRTSGQPIQSFPTDMFRLFGQITNPGSGDPDFDLLRITAGTDFGLPSPGHTTLTKSGPDWSVDSYFDIVYRIDFVGAPGGSLAGMSGSTTGTIRMQAGQETPPATVFDHFECFKAKDSVKVTALVDLPSFAGGSYSALGCTVGVAKKYCTPVMKTVTSSTPAATVMPGPNLTSDYICYKLKCPKVALTQALTDQFGPHTLSKMSQKELCVPAVKP